MARLNRTDALEREIDELEKKGNEIIGSLKEELSTYMKDNPKPEADGRPLTKFEDDLLELHAEYKDILDSILVKQARLGHLDDEDLKKYR